MQANGAKLSYAKVSDKMTGRTPKALTHLWEKLSKDYANTADDAAAGTSAAAAGTAADGQPDPSTPANKRGKAGKFICLCIYLYLYAYTCSGIFRAYHCGTYLYSLFYFALLAIGKAENTRCVVVFKTIC